MIAAASAHAALEALWQVMVELAETTNDQIVQRQASANATDATAVQDACSDLAQIARTAASLARLVAES